MEDKCGFVITTRDKVLRAWFHSTELVRDYELYYKEIEDDKEIAELFAKYAEDEGLHAAKLLEILQKYDMEGK